MSLELRNASAGAVFVLLSGAAANAAGALDDAICVLSEHHNSLAEEEGFEPSVPRKRDNGFETARFDPSGAFPSARTAGSSLKGTGGSNPVPQPNARQDARSTASVLSRGHAAGRIGSITPERGAHPPEPGDFRTIDGVYLTIFSKV